MSSHEAIYVDADQPAALVRAGKMIDCPTLREAVVEWRKLPDTLKETTSITAAGTGVIYKFAEIERLHDQSDPSAASIAPDDLNATNDE
jgi:hypothetical protein